MKRKFLVILSTVIATLTLGYLFLLSWLLGFLAAKHVAGESVGTRGKLGSIIIPFRRWRIHIHHWLYSLGLVGLSLATGIHFLTPSITYGLLGGLVFQGVYYYSDWHIVLTGGRQTRGTENGTQGKQTALKPISPDEDILRV